MTHCQQRVLLRALHYGRLARDAPDHKTGKHFEWMAMNCIYAAVVKELIIENDRSA